MNPGLIKYEPLMPETYSEKSFTKKQLIEAMADIPDDAEILVKGYNTCALFNVSAVVGAVYVLGNHKYYLEVAKKLAKEKVNEG